MNKQDETSELLEPIYGFLHCQTPKGWIDAAVDNLNILLIDHANCEKKAASTAMSMIYKYVDREELLVKMSRLAREELHHFEQVVGIMLERQVEYQHLSPSRYAKGLMQGVRTFEPATLIDKLIIGAYIEARSCERFACLLPHLDEDLARFYRSLLRSEARHYSDYLELARLYSAEPVEDRIRFFGELEAQLIQSPDTEFRFHSGLPA